MQQQNTDLTAKAVTSTDGESKITVAKKPAPVQETVQATPKVEVEPVAESEVALDPDSDFDAEVDVAVATPAVEQTHTETEIAQEVKRELVDPVVEAVIATEMQSPVEQETVSVKVETETQTTLGVPTDNLPDLVNQVLNSVPEVLDELGPDYDEPKSAITTPAPSTLNRSLVKGVLSLASMGFTIRKTLISAPTLASWSDGVQYVENLELLALFVRLPKSAELPFLQNLDAVYNVLGTIFDSLRLKFSVRAFTTADGSKIKNSGMNLKSLSTATREGSIVPFNGGDDEIAGQDIVILLTPLEPSTLEIIGELGVDSFLYNPQTLDAIAPSLTSVAKYVRVLASKGLVVGVPDPILLQGFTHSYSKVDTSIEDADGEYAGFLNQHQERYNLEILLNPNQTMSDLYSIINPEFLGERLLEHANAVEGAADDVELKRYLSATAVLSEAKGYLDFNPLFASRALLSLTFIHNLQFSDAVDTDEDDEDEDED